MLIIFHWLHLETRFEIIFNVIPIRTGSRRMLGNPSIDLAGRACGVTWQTRFP